MSESDLHELKSFIKQTFREVMAEVENEKTMKELLRKKFVNQSEAMRILLGVGIGRARFERLLLRGEIRFDKEETGARNSAVRVYAEDIYKLLICDQN